MFEWVKIPGLQKTEFKGNLKFVSFILVAMESLHPDGSFFFKCLNGAVPSRKCSIKVSLIKLDAFLNHISDWHQLKELKQDSNRSQKKGVFQKTAVNF